MDIYRFDPPEDVPLRDLIDFLKVLQPYIDQRIYDQAPENVRRMFKPSVFSPSPSNMMN